MSTGSPEFVMPPPVPTAAAAPSDRSVREAKPEAAPTTADPEDAAPLTRSLPRTGFRRTLLAVGAAGIVVGALAQAGVLALADAAAEAQITSLESVAMDYLTAIAEGRAADATAMVPPEALGEVAPDAVLADATPIGEYAASVVGRVDDEAAAVLVRFAIGAIEVDRLLDARFIDGRWQLLTSLTEAPDIYYDHQLAVTVLGGVEIVPTRPPLLYPGAYRPEVVDSGLFRTVGSSFVIDGDPETRPEAWAGIELDMEAAVTARGLAVSTVEECQAVATCGVPPEAEIEVVEDAMLVSVETRSGAITTGTTVSIGDRWVEVRLRATRDPDSGRTQWLCPEPARLDLPVVPCGH